MKKIALFTMVLAKANVPAPELISPVIQSNLIYQLELTLLLMTENVRNHLIK